MSLRLPVSARGAFTTPALSLFLVLVIAALSYLGVAAPVLLAEGRTATIQRAMASVPELNRWPSATSPGLPAFGGTSDPAVGVWGQALAAAEAKRQQQPEPLRGLLGTPRLSMMLDPQATRDEDPDRVQDVPRNKVGLVSDPGLIGRSELVTGRLPQASEPGLGIEIALTEPIARQLEWPVGAARSWGELTLTLTGLVAPSHRGDPDWTFVGGSLEPAIELDANGNRILVAAAFMHVDEMARLTDRIREIKITSWMPFDTAGVDAATARQTAAQLRLLPADPAMIPMYDDTFYDRGLPYLSSLPQAIDAGIVRADVMTAVTTVAAVGPVVVALVVLALVSRLIAVRRVEPARVLRARGASRRRLVALLGGEGAALGALGALIGAGAAAVRPGWIGGWVLLVPTVLAAAPAITLPWGVLSDAERRGRSDLAESGRGGWARPAVEILILVVTVVLAALVVTGGGTGGADPLLLALLVLLGASGSVLTLRLLPLLLGVAERRGRRRAGLAALLGPARAGRDRVVRTAPVLGVVVGLGVAVFSVAFSATVSGGIVRSAEMRVGADLRVESAYIDTAGAERVAGLDGVAAVAGLHGDSSVEAASDGQTARARVYTVDRGELLAVQRGFAAPLPLPAALAEPATGSSDPTGAVPVVVSEQLLAQLGLDAAATEFEVAGTPVRVVGTAPSQVPFGTAEQWVIVDLSNAAALGERDTGISQLYVSLMPGADPDSVGEAAVAALGEGTEFQTPGEAAAVYAEDPGYAVVQGALLAASAVVALLLAVAIVATLVLGSASRARMLAILRTLGHPPRAAGRLVAWEVAPALLLALPFGVGAGIAMALLVIPQLDLRGFVGGLVQPPVVLGGVWLPVVVAGFTVIAGGAVVGAAVLASRLGTATAIRADDDRMQ